MKQREQADLLLRKAAQDEALLDEVIGSERVSDEVIGFHRQQAAEKLLKALLSNLGVPFRKTHELGALLEVVARSGVEVPTEFADLDTLTPFSALYRYDDFDAGESFDRQHSRTLLRSLRGWVESCLGDRSGPKT